MEETDQTQADQDPAPLKDSDAERVTGKEADPKHQTNQPDENEDEG